MEKIGKINMIKIKRMKKVNKQLALTLKNSQLKERKFLESLVFS